MTDSLYDRPELYDLMAPADPEMERYYVTAAQERGGRVLDLCCGTGRITLPLAQAGLSVAGGDIALPMLATARARAAGEGLATTFHQLDMRDFALAAPVDTIVVAANSLMHLTEITDFDGFFASVRRNLAPGGRLLFDVFVPSAVMLARPPDARHPVAASDGPGGRITLEETIRYDAATQISHVEWFWSRPDAPDFWRHELTLRQIYPQELPLLLKRGGLRLMSRYGAFDRSPFGPQSHRQVCVAVSA